MPGRADAHLLGTETEPCCSMERQLLQPILESSASRETSSQAIFMDTAKPVCLLSSTSTAKQCNSKVLTDQGILIGSGAFRLRVVDSHFHTCLCLQQAMHVSGKWKALTDTCSALHPWTCAAGDRTGACSPRPHRQILVESCRLGPISP